MIPLEAMPEFDRWGRAWARLTASDLPVWILGAPGTGVSTVGAALAHARHQAFLDDADQESPDTLKTWLRTHPNGVFGLHRRPGLLEDLLAQGLVLELSSLETCPGSVRSVLEAMASAEGIEGPLPEALGLLPCPGNLRGLHNRLLRWSLLGQLPEQVASADAMLPLDDDNLAANLHILERLLLHRALRRAYGNRMEAAKRLGVSRRQLYLLIARHGDPVRNQSPVSPGPKRLVKNR